MKFTAIAAAALMLGAAALPASAAQMNIWGEQVGADVVITYSGAFDLTGFSEGSTFAWVSEARNLYFVLGDTSVSITTHSASGPWSTSFAFADLTADASTGDRMGMGNVGGVYTPPGYTSGAQLSGSAQFNNITLADLGFRALTTTLENNTVTFVIGSAQAPAADVPVPAAGLLLLSGLGAVAALRRKG